VLGVHHGFCRVRVRTRIVLVYITRFWTGFRSSPLLLGFTMLLELKPDHTCDVISVKAEFMVDHTCDSTDSKPLGMSTLSPFGTNIQPAETL
jgi:hypothetical protein